MARAKTAYVCSDCGSVSVKWAGQCPECDAWNTLSETAISSRTAVPQSEAQSLDDVLGDLGERFGTGFDEFDRVLGGGVVQGSVVLIGGDPGVGKSTLAVNLATSLAMRYPEDVLLIDTSLQMGVCAPMLM